MADSNGPGRLEGPRPGEDPATLFAVRNQAVDVACLPLTDPDGLSIDTGTKATLVTLAGEIDLTNHARLRTVLDQAVSGGLSDVYLNVVELDFIDVAGMGLVIDAAQRLGDRRLYLIGPSRTLRLILQVFEEVIPANLLAMGRWPGDFSPQQGGKRSSQLPEQRNPVHECGRSTVERTVGLSPQRSGTNA